MRQAKPRLAFVSPTFLFPNDAGGKIRTTNILRGLNGGAFDVTLVSVASAEQQHRWRTELKGVCDQFIGWEPVQKLPRWTRALGLVNAMPVNVLADRTEAGLHVVQATAAGGNYDIIVFDFVHGAVLMPDDLACATVCFTHNVEAEIFDRHATQASNGLLRWIWRSQHAKMQHFERTALRRFTSVVAVSERDREHFRDVYGLTEVAAIPTGVDLDFFRWCAPIAAPAAPTAVFTGSMNWTANIDGMQYFIKNVWPTVLATLPLARLQVVGRDPPAALTNLARSVAGIEFTGFVDDVRPYVHAAQVFVIPLLVGGGTRIKAFEAMAMGCPIVSTSIGMEGLEVTAGQHFLCEDSEAGMAQAILRLFSDHGMCSVMSRAARDRVEEKFGHRVAAAVFERICLDAVHRHASV